MTANGHENGDGDLVTTTGHDDLPGVKGTTHARAGTGIGQKTETGHSASGPDETGSGPKTATGRGGKPSGSELDETGSGPKTATGRGGKPSGSELDETGSGLKTATGRGGKPSGSELDETGSGPKTATGRGGKPSGSELDETGSGLKTATGRGGKPSGSELDETGSGPKTATGPAETIHEQKATETSPAYHAPDLLTVNWKRSESDETGHERDPTGSGLHDPSVILGPKTGKHGKNENRNGLPKTLPTHHIAEHAVMSGESKPKTGRSPQGTAVTEPLLDPQPPKGQRRQKRARTHRQSHQRHFHLSHSQHGEREERQHHGQQHKVHPETPPSHPAILKGGRKKKEPQGA